jgi:hypothetical protein
LLRFRNQRGARRCDERPSRPIEEWGFSSKRKGIHNSAGAALAPAIEKVGQKSYSWAGEFTAASAKTIDEYIDEYLDNSPAIPATSVQEIENQLQPFVEAGVDRLIVPYVPVTEPVIDDALRFVDARDKL